MEYKINTMQDMLNVITAENIDAFLKDFEGVIRSGLLIKELAKATPKTDGFIWVDDGKHNINIVCKRITKKTVKNQ
jgi:hypothetical protein